jgi:hypothetical protein
MVWTDSTDSEQEQIAGFSEEDEGHSGSLKEGISLPAVNQHFKNGL